MLASPSPTEEDAEGSRNQTADEVCNQPSVALLLQTHYIYLTFALIHSHKCKKLVRLLSYYGNKHTNPGFAAIHPFVALCYLLNKNVFIYEFMLYLNIYTLSQESTFKKTKHLFIHHRLVKSQL